jgi:hypothetical protein
MECNKTVLTGKMVGSLEDPQRQLFLYYWLHTWPRRALHAWLQSWLLGIMPDDPAQLLHSLGRDDTVTQWQQPQCTQQLHSCRFGLNCGDYHAFSIQNAQFLCLMWQQTNTNPVQWQRNAEHLTQLTSHYSTAAGSSCLTNQHANCPSASGAGSAHAATKLLALTSCAPAQTRMPHCCQI